VAATAATSGNRATGDEPATETAEIVLNEEVQDAEPSNAELEDAITGVGNGSKRVSPPEVTFKPEMRAYRDGAAKRPQPQNKSRSQRKK
jgi:hypothetical protein